MCLYPTRYYRDATEPKVGDVVRPHQPQHGCSPSFDDCLIVSIEQDTGHDDADVTLARPHAYLQMDGQIEMRTERHTVPLRRLVDGYLAVTTGAAGTVENRLQPLPPAFDVIVPWSEMPTKWHPTERSFAPLCRGAFKTIADAVTWAVRHLGGQPYSIAYRDPMADPELRAEYERHVGHPLDLEQRSRDAHASIIDVDEVLMHAPSCFLAKGCRR